MSDKLVYHVNIQPSEALSRIASSIDEERRGLSLSGFSGNRAYLGGIEGHKFRIQKRRYLYGNPFARRLYGEVQGDGSGSTVVAEFRMDVVAKLFAAFYFVFPVKVFIGLLPQGVSSLLHGEVLYGLLLISGPIGFMLFGVLLLRFSWLLGKPEERAITRLLDDLFGEQVPAA